MAKFNGILTKGTGRLGGGVFSIRNGVQIVRAYQPNVANPKSAAQVEARAKLKLLSQLSSIMAPVIAMPRVGLVSPRNFFTQKNYTATTYSDGQADITLTNVKITNSILALGNVFAERGTNEITISTSGSVATEFDKVVYVAFGKSESSRLFYLGSVVSETRSGGFPASIPTSFTGESVVYAYGIRINNQATRVVFGQLETVSAETIAKLIVTKTVSAEDVSLSDTVATVLAAQA